MAENSGAPDPDRRTTHQNSNWQIPDAKDALNYLLGLTDRMGRAGRLISLLIPLLILAFALSSILTWTVDLADDAEKAIDYLQHRWLGDSSVTIFVNNLPDIDIRVVATTMENREAARTDPISGKDGTTIRLARGQTYSVTIASDLTHPLTREISIDRTVGDVRCVARLAWKEDRRPADVEGFVCNSEAPAKSGKLLEADPFERRIDHLEETLVTWALALTQTQFETARINLNEAAGIAAFIDRPPFPVDLSFGILQWSFRGCTLQPVIAHMRRLAPDAFRDAFGPGDRFLADLLAIPCNEVRSGHADELLRSAFSGSFDRTWKPRFARLGTDPRIQDLQAAEVRQWVSRAVREADCFGLHSKRGLAVLFSIAVTWGSLSDEIWRKFQPAADADESARLQALSDAVQSFSPVASIMNRRLPALLGQDASHPLDLGLSRFEPPGEPSACQRRPEQQAG